MQANKAELSELLGNSTRHLYSPVFQRRYVWGDEQLEQLWEDLELAAYENKDHLVGTVVLEANAQGSREFMIVDGQQRLTTLTLFLKAAQLRIRQELPNDEEAAALSKLLVNRRPVARSGELDYTVLRVCPALRDRGHYYRIVVDGVIPRKLPDKSKVPAAFRFFQQALLSRPLTEVRQLVEAALVRFVFVRILLDHDDDACAAFANINGLGMQLSPTELSKNYILANRKVADAEKLNQLYWKPLEDDFPAEKQQLEVIHIACVLLSGTTSKTDAYSRLSKIAKGQRPGLTFASEESFLETFSKIYRAVRAATPDKPHDFAHTRFDDYWWVRDNLVTAYGYGAKLLFSAINLAFIQERISEEQHALAISMAENFIVRVYFNNESHHASTHLAKDLKTLLDFEGAEFLARLGQGLFEAPCYPDASEFKRSLEQAHETSKDALMLQYVLLRLERYLSGPSSLGLKNTNLVPLAGTTADEYGHALQTRQLKPATAKPVPLATAFYVKTGEDLGLAAAMRADALIEHAMELWSSAS